ncbi:DUF805 domain-containing protein [Halovulum sp. GXIMD14793]
MTLVSAAKNGFRHSFDFSGRMTRCAYWAFAPSAVILPLVALFITVKTGMDLWQIYLAVFICAIPFMSASARRLQDAGEYGGLVVKLAFIVGIFLSLPWLLYWTFTGGMYAALCHHFFVMPLIYFIIFIVPIIVITVLWVVIAFLINFVPLPGMLLLPSEPKPNRYGPNPHEVTP